MPDKSDAKRKLSSSGRDKDKVKIESVKRKSSDSGSQSEKKVKIERKPEDRKTEKKDVKLIKKTTSTKISTKTDVKRPENKKAEKPKLSNFPEFDEDSFVKMSKYDGISADFNQTSLQIKSIMSSLINMKRDGKIDDKDKFHQLRTDGCLQIAVLKRLNRFAQVTARDAREETKDNLNKSDGHFLKLQNLQYQAHHLQNEIDSCLRFHSAHKDLELKSEDDFDRNAPDELKTEEVMMGDEHEVICARLKWENQERIELQKTMDLGSEKKDTLEEEVQRKLTNLNNVRPQLQNIMQAANGVRAKLGLGGVVGVIGEAVSFLTLPLGAIYKAGVAYRQTNGNLEVSIQGDEKEAMEMKEKGFEDEDAERNESIEGDEGGRRARKKKRSQKGWFPVWIEWKLNNKVIQFKHSTLNKSIYAETSSDVNSPNLSCLYPGDAGIESSQSSFGRSYWWVSQLAGLQDLPHNQSLSDFVSDLVSRLNARFDNLILADAHLKSLLGKQLPTSISDEIITSGSINSFESNDEFNNYRNIKAHMDGKIYKMTITQKNGDILSAKCSIPPNYPVDATRFSIEMKERNSCNCAIIQSLEESVNLRIPLLATNQDEVLSYQVAALLSQPIATKITTRNRVYPLKLL